MKIYTKTGDKGFTSLTGGARIKKNDSLVETYGTIDEANSMIGFALSQMRGSQLKKVENMLIQVQEDLFHVGSEISTPAGEKVYWPLKKQQIVHLEHFIDELDKEIPQLTQFILPGGSTPGAALHVARSIVRRAERLAVELDNGKVISYLNRCSDFLFVAARWVNFQLNQSEPAFKPKE